MIQLQIHYSSIIFASLFLIQLVISIDLLQDPGSTGCHEESYRVINCNGNNINISEFLASVPADKDPPTFYFPRFKRLKLLNTNLSFIEENTIKFQGFDFEGIFISNAPKLKYIHPRAFISLKDTLEDFRAINTALPDYNDVSSLPSGIKNPFDGFSKLIGIFVSTEDSHCPSLETIAPCTCTFGVGGRTQPFGLYGETRSYDAAFPNTTELTCKITETFTVENLKVVFQNLYQRMEFFPKRFDVLNLHGSEYISYMPEDLFGGITFTAVWMDNMLHLNSIHPETFGNAKKTIQILQVKGGNFTEASDQEVENIFAAFSSLTNLRILRIWEAGIPYIPSHAFNGKMHNLHSVSIAFDRRKHTKGIRTIGSYAFAGASNLRELGLISNFIEKFEPYSFGFNKTSPVPLKVEIGRNPFNDKNGLAPDAWSGAQRPLLIKYEIDNFAASDPANDPSFNYIPENVFRPFFEENPQNTLIIDYFNVEIWCNENASWLFDLETGILKDRVSKGIKVKRVEENVVASEPISSIQCKPLSSFKGLPHCLGFPKNGLIHCGGVADKNFSVREGLRNMLCGRKNYTNFIFSTKEVREFPSGALEDFELTKIYFQGSSELTFIHPNAFGSLTLNSLTQFSALGTNLTTYPNFGMFSNLTKINLDDSIPYHIKSSNFDFSNRTSSENSQSIIISMDYGSIEPNTFTKIGNQTSIELIIGKRRDCSTIACLYRCDPSELLLEEITFQAFLEANPRNKLITSCNVNCSCKLNWLHKDWKKFQENDQVRVFNGHDALHCINPGNGNTKVSESGTTPSNDYEDSILSLFPQSKGLVTYETYADNYCQ